MTHVYKPHGPYDSPVDPDRCKSAVYRRDRMLGFYQCSRKPWKDRWCKQHHPDTEAARRAQGALRAQRRWGAGGKTRAVKVEMASQLRKAHEEIAQLKGRIAELEGEQP